MEGQVPVRPHIGAQINELRLMFERLGAVHEFAPGDIIRPKERTGDAFPGIDAMVFMRRLDGACFPDDAALRDAFVERMLSPPPDCEIGFFDPNGVWQIACGQMRYFEPLPGAEASRKDGFDGARMSPPAPSVEGTEPLADEAHDILISLEAVK
jgi:hypothetical protein